MKLLLGHGVFHLSRIDVLDWAGRGGGSGVPHVVRMSQINTFEQVHVMGVRGPHVVGGIPLVMVNWESPHPNRQI